MPHDICIVHIEDEFPQMKPFPSKMKDYVEQYWNEVDDTDNFTSMREIKPADKNDQSWVVYDIKCPRETEQRIRYIFIGPRQIPGNVTEYFSGKPHFIIDVLRPAENAQKLWSTGDESIKSAMEHGGRADTITIFTACQGSDLQTLQAKYPDIELISKANIQEFNRLISRIVVRGMNHG